MNRRLSCIQSHIPTGIGTVDVGTDHAFLPISLAQTGYPGNLFATDIRSGPLKMAQRNVEQAGLSDRILLYLCDGLELCPQDQIDCIVIAGMGGDTICGILDRAEWCMDIRYTLVLQPMTRAEVLRYWLVYNDFEILDEDLVEDGGTIYPVICTRYGGKTRLSDAELFTGKVSLLQDHPLFNSWINMLASRFERKLTGMRSSEKSSAAQIRLCSEILKQLTEINEHDKRSEHL